MQTLEGPVSVHTRGAFRGRAAGSRGGKRRVAASAAPSGHLAGGSVQAGGNAYQGTRPGTGGALRATASKAVLAVQPSHTPQQRPVTSTATFQRFMGGTAEQALLAANASGMAAALAQSSAAAVARKDAEAAVGGSGSGGSGGGVAKGGTGAGLPSTAAAAAAGTLLPAGVVGGGDFNSTTTAAASVPWVAGGAGASLKGHNPLAPKPNQDRMLLLEHADSRSLIVAVFDGHGANGHFVSDFVATRLPHECVSDPRWADDAALPAVLADALLAVEVQLLQAGHIDTALSGSTAVAGVLRAGALHVASCGDSRMVKVRAPTAPRRPASVTPLTVDHKPDDPTERRRITAAGGRVMATRSRLAPHIVGPARVWLRDVPAPGLAMSRSLGDMVAKAAGVVSTPDTASTRLAAGDTHIVLGSDGIWDFVSNAEVAATCTSCGDPGRAAEALVKLARQRWLERTGGSDDITVVVLQLAPAGKG